MIVRLPAALVLMVCASGCPSTPAGAPAATKAACRAAGHRLTAKLIERNRKRYVAVRDRALAYLDTFAIDPVELRARGIKGRKKLVELLDGYVAVHRHADAPLRQQLSVRFRKAASVTARPDYHDMATVDDKQFRQDATSYLRACYLMEKMGLDTSAYRKEIAKVRPRLDAHMSRRGAHQRMAFGWYYRHFGFELPPALREPPKSSVIARRVNPYLLRAEQAYDLTHEVFVPFDYGGKLTTADLSAADRSYLRRALEVQTTIWIGRRNADLVGELLTCMRFLGDTDLQVFRDGIGYLLASQRPNGAFGDYERHRARRGDQLELDAYLHTTSVALDILPLAFEGPPAR